MCCRCGTYQDIKTFDDQLFGHRKGYRDGWTEAVEKATVDVCNKIANAAFVVTSDLPSNEEELHNGDLDHFSKNSIKLLGKRYFEAFASLKRN